MKSFWFRLKCWLLGRKYVCGVDVGQNGDYTVEIEGYRKNGVTFLTKERIIKGIEQLDGKKARNVHNT
jgi:hypothetical protein